MDYLILKIKNYGELKYNFDKKNKIINSNIILEKNDKKKHRIYYKNYKNNKLKKLQYPKNSNIIHIYNSNFKIVFS